MDDGTEGMYCARLCHKDTYCVGFELQQIPGDEHFLCKFISEPRQIYTLMDSNGSEIWYKEILWLQVASTPRGIMTDAVTHRRHVFFRFLRPSLKINSCSFSNLTFDALNTPETHENCVSSLFPIFPNFLGGSHRTWRLTPSALQVNKFCTTV